MNWKSVFVTRLAGGLFSCSSNLIDKELFNGEIHQLDDSRTVCMNVSAKLLNLEGDYTGMIAVYDSILVCWDTNYKDYFLNLFHIDKGEEIGYFCPKGHGPEEFSNINPVYQFFQMDGNIMTMFHGDSHALAFWNLTKSLQTGKTVYDTIINGYRDLGLFFFYLPNKNLVSVKSAEYTEKHSATMPYCERFSLFSSVESQKIPIYQTEMVTGESADQPVGRFFHTWDAVKPDGTKLVQAMSFLPQLNIIDLESGRVTGYRMKESPDYSLIKTDMKNLKRYYTSIQADNQYIYATYFGEGSWMGKQGTALPKFDEIHVFDWNGNLLYKFKTDRSFFIIWLDSVRHRLYSRDWNTDEIYYIELKDLGL